MHDLLHAGAAQLEAIYLRACGDAPLLSLQAWLRLCRAATLPAISAATAAAAKASPQGGSSVHAASRPAVRLTESQARAVFEVTYTGGPSERCFCDFLCMLVRQSLCLGDLPHGLEALLRERLYPRAALDERPLVRIELASDPELRAVLRSHASSLQAVYDAACAHGDGGGGGGGGGGSGGEGAAAGVSASAVVALLRDKALLHA